MFLPHKQEEPCGGGALVLLMEKAVTLSQGALSGIECNRIFVPTWLPGSFLCPETCHGFLLQYIKFYHFLQLHFDQFGIAVLDFSYTSIST